MSTPAVTAYAVSTRAEGPADGHRRDGEQAEHEESRQGADEAEALGLRHLSMPFLFSDHAHDPLHALLKVAAATPRRHAAPSDPPFCCRLQWGDSLG